MSSSHLILCRPLLLLPPIPPSIRVFSNESTLRMRWPKYWSLSFSIIPSKEQPGLISFRMDWLDLLAVQGALKSLLQHHSSKASILRCSAFFTVQLSHPYVTNGKTIALTRRTFVGKVMSLLTLGYNPLLLYFVTQSVHLRLLGAHSVGSYVPFTYFKNVVMVLFSFSKVPHLKEPQCASNSSEIFPACALICHFSKEHWLLLFKSVIKKQDSGLLGPFN